MAKLNTFARIRSKNTGPWEICFDILFHNAEAYAKVKKTGIVNAGLFSSLYGVPVEKCLFAEFDNGWAMKCTLQRNIVSGHVGDSDVYGSHQYFPLLDVEIPG